MPYPRTIAGAAFCGFYVGKADAGLFNQASQFIMVRDGERTVISMLNDYRGPLGEFALVVPVPQRLQRDQIHVGDKKLFERIDAYSAPRLAEYHDDDPCTRRYLEKKESRNAQPLPGSPVQFFGIATGTTRNEVFTLSATP